MRKATMNKILLVWVGALSLLGGCIAAPNVVMVDKKTALEKQAAGEFRALENDLQQAGISPKPEAMTRGQLEEQRADLRESSLGEIVRLYSAVQSDAEVVDGHLITGCIGEAKDGLLKATPDECNADVNPDEMTSLIERTNRHRKQMWRMIREKNPKASLDKVRSTWRKRHLQRIVCDGLYQTDAGFWEAKQCEEE